MLRCQFARMSEQDSQLNLTRRQFLKGTASAVATRVLGVCLPPGAVVLSGCTDKRSPEQLAKRLVIAIDERVRTLDPAYQTMALDSWIICNIFDTMTWYTRELELVPRLALSWESPDNAQSWIFNLRPNVKFHDDTPVDAAAVKFHFDRIMDPKTESKRITKVAKIDRVEVIDPLRVQFFMKQPDALWPVVARDAFAAIVSPTAARKVPPKEFTFNPIGSGPFMFAEQAEGDRIILKRNPNYWDASEFHVEEVEFRTVREPTTRLILLEQGAVDLCNITFAHTEVAEKTKNVIVEKAPKLQVRYVGFNTQKPPFDDKRVRYAANYALNKAELIKYGFRGNADALLGPLPTVLPNFNKNLNQFDYDPDRAKDLLKEAGYENGIDVVMWTKDDVDDTNLGVVVADQLRRVGIRVEILRFDRNVFWEKFDAYITSKAEWFPRKEGVFDMFAAGWVGGEHPTGYLDPLFRSTSASNNTFYKSDTVDELLLATQRTLDDNKRDQLYDEIQAQIIEDAPWIFCYSSRTLWGVNPRVKNMFPHPAGEYEFGGVEMAGGEGRL